METSKTSTGETLFDLTSFVEDTLANPSALPASAKVSKILAIYGHMFGEPLANYDLDMQSWKMSPVTSRWGLTEFLVTLPKSGMTRSGNLYQLPRRVPRTSENVSLSWPTPTVVTPPMEGNVRMYRAKIAMGEMTEQEAEAILGKSVWEAQGKIPPMWPTPTTQEVEHPDMTITETGRRLSKDGKSSHSLGLADSVKMWPTPTASSWGNEGSQQLLEKRVNDGTITSEQKKQMVRGNGGKLNPNWVEWLMGFPPGWTDLED